MKRGNQIQLCVVVDAVSNTGNALNDTVTGSIDELAKYPDFEHMPVQWRFAAVALEGFALTFPRAAALLRLRVASGGDTLVPSGFSGAPHTLLLPEDLECEIEWAFLNPWGCGIQEVFNTDERFLFPSVVDRRRASALRLYETDSLVLLERHADGRDRMLCTATLSGTERITVPVVRAGPTQEKTLRKLLRSRSQKRCTQSVVVLADTQSLPGLLSLLSSIADDRRRFRMASLPDILHGERRRPTEQAGMRPSARVDTDIDLSESPLDRLRRAGSGYAREEINTGSRNRRSPQANPHASWNHNQAKRNLLQTSTDNQRATPPAPLRPPKSQERVLIADMTGSVVLEGDSMSVLFSEGRMEGFVIEGSEVLLDRPVGAHFTVDGTEYPCSTAGAYSFEGLEVRGLRERSFADIPGTDASVSINTDYVFADGYPHLFVSLTVEYPVFLGDGVIDSFALFELQLSSRASTGSVLDLRARYPNGERTIATSDKNTDSGVFFGTLFTVSGGEADVDLFVSFPETEITRISCLPYIRTRRRKLEILRINPGGSYTQIPTASFSGIREHLLLVVGGGAAAESGPLPPTGAILNRVGRPWVLPPE